MEGWTSSSALSLVLRCSSSVTNLSMLLLLRGFPSAQTELSAIQLLDGYQCLSEVAVIRFFNTANVH